MLCPSTRTRNRSPPPPAEASDQANIPVELPDPLAILQPQADEDDRGPARRVRQAGIERGLGAPRQGRETIGQALAHAVGAERQEGRRAGDGSLQQGQRAFDPAIHTSGDFRKDGVDRKDRLVAAGEQEHRRRATERQHVVDRGQLVPDGVTDVRVFEDDPDACRPGRAVDQGREKVLPPQPDLHEGRGVEPDARQVGPGVGRVGSNVQQGRCEAGVLADQRAQRLVPVRRVADKPEARHGQVDREAEIAAVRMARLLPAARDDLLRHQFGQMGRRPRRRAVEPRQRRVHRLCPRIGTAARHDPDSLLRVGGSRAREGFDQEMDILDHGPRARRAIVVGEKRLRLPVERPRPVPWRGEELRRAGCQRRAVRVQEPERARVVGTHERDHRGAPAEIDQAERGPAGLGRTMRHESPVAARDRVPRSLQPTGMADDHRRPSSASSERVCRTSGIATRRPVGASPGQADPIAFTAPATPSLPPPPERLTGARPGVAADGRTAACLENGVDKAAHRRRAGAAAPASPRILDRGERCRRARDRLSRGHGRAGSLRPASFDDGHDRHGGRLRSVGARRSARSATRGCDRCRIWRCPRSGERWRSALGRNAARPGREPHARMTRPPGAGLEDRG